MKFAAVLGFVLLVAFTRLPAAPVETPATLERIDGLTLVGDGGGDADSFHVTDGQRTLHLRLYLVDAPETSAADPTLARRVREQTRYFGLPTPADTLRFGRAAAARSRELLARPFTAHTAGTRGLGRSAEPRVYAFVTTADGADLADILVREGLARAYGVGRTGPTGVTQDEQRAHLADLELSAGLARRGIWAASDPEKLAAARAEERRDAADLAAVSAAAKAPATTPSGEPVAATPLNLNTASLAELDTLPGIGPALAKRIVAARPFATTDGLAAVPGIGPATLARLRPLVTAP
jgi:competence protein ComEA